MLFLSLPQDLIGSEMNISTYCHIQAANVHALLMTIPYRAGTKPKVLTSSTDDLKCVMSNL